DGRLLEFLDGDPTHVRIGIGPRDGTEAILIVSRHLAHGTSADDGVGMAPARSKSSYQVHRRKPGLHVLSTTRRGLEPSTSWQGGPIPAPGRSTRVSVPCAAAGRGPPPHAPPPRPRRPLEQDDDEACGSVAHHGPHASLWRERGTRGRPERLAGVRHAGCRRQPGEQGEKLLGSRQPLPATLGGGGRLGPFHRPGPWVLLPLPTGPSVA